MTRPSSYAGTLTVGTNGATTALTTSITGASAPAVTLTYALGDAGSGGYYGLSGGTGGQTRVSLTVSGVNYSLTANGGAGASGNNDNAGGTAGGGSSNTTGGAGRGAAGDIGGGGGGAIQNAPAPAFSGVNGGTGAQSTSNNGIQAAIEAAGYSFTGPGAGGSSSATTDAQTGGSATGIGSGGGGGGFLGGDGGKGLYGGGGGGAAGNGSIYHSGGAGGSGAVLLQFSDSTAILLTSGTSYTVPAGKKLKCIWVIGAGGGGASAREADASGSGGGAGGTAYREF